MKYYKKYEYGMWHVHAFDDDVPDDVVLELAGKLEPISEAEAHGIQKQPPSTEYQQRIDEGVKALGGRGGLVRWPPKEYKEAIGHICVNAAHLEITIRTVIWTVAGLDVDAGIAITGTSDRTVLMKMLERLVDARIQSLSQVVRAINKEMDSLYVRRNKFVHKAWTVTKDGKPAISEAFLKKDLRMAEVSLDELYEVAEGFMRIEGMLHTQIVLPLLQNSSHLQINPKCASSP